MGQHPRHAGHPRLGVNQLERQFPEEGPDFRGLRFQAQQSLALDQPGAAKIIGAGQQFRGAFRFEMGLTALSLLIDDILVADDHIVISGGRQPFGDGRGLQHRVSVGQQHPFGARAAG